DSAFYRVTHHWAAPDSLKNEIPGLRISPYRHWELQLIQSGNINLRGRFFYSNSAVLDATLIQSINDSVVMLYRPNTASDWEAISQERTGSWNMGNIIVHNLLPGQYTLAVWDKQLVGKAENTLVAEIKKLKAEPNPARDFVNLSWEKNLSGILTIVDSTGKTVMQKNIQHEKRLSIQTEKWPKGMYFAELVKLTGESAGFVKIIIQ
ncbi:MAG: T9SS type A sorting domain-containing protein, partial [Bacteroidales bacterium]|nr:T9SS type A sorting domain-containing protein [Bacteroidales bacterium]